MELDTVVKSGHQFRVVSAGALPPSAPNVAAERSVKEERLPFTVRIVRTEDQLKKAVEIRHSAYDRHIPAVAALLESAEAADYEPGSVVLVAESKLDGSPVGTMRIQTNRFRPLALEQSITLPGWLHGQSLAEATRLGVAGNRVGRLVKIALFKAYYEYCVLSEIEWMVIAARSPLDRQYAALLFQDVTPDGEFVPMRHAGNIPHRILAFNIERSQAVRQAAKHPLFDFVINTRHPDIDLCDAGPLFAQQETYLRRANA